MAANASFLKKKGRLSFAITKSINKMATSSKRSGAHKTLKNDAARIGAAANTISEAREAIEENVHVNLSREDEIEALGEMIDQLNEMEDKLWEMQEEICEEGGFDYRMILMIYKTKIALGESKCK